MEEKRIQIIGEEPQFAMQSYESLEKMQEYCKILAAGMTIPDHFYEKKVGSSGNERDYSKPIIPKMISVLSYGYALGLRAPTLILQWIVPINGGFAIRGDMAKSLILRSSLVEPGSWQEVEEGKIEDGNYRVTITAQRRDTKEKLSRSFSVYDAKKAGLWITEEMVRGSEGWKYKKSAWYRFPKRMIRYRALGFLARDLFPDVMAATYLFEEIDTVEKETIIETENGSTVIIPDKQFNQERSKKLVEKTIEKIEKNQLKDVVPETENSNVQKSDVIEIAKISETQEPEVEETEKETEFEEGYNEEKFTEEELKALPVEKLLEIIEAIPELDEYVKSLPGKNTNKKLREAILYYQDGNLRSKTEENKPEQLPKDPCKFSRYWSVFNKTEENKPEQLPKELEVDDAGPGLEENVAESEVDNSFTDDEGGAKLPFDLAEIGKKEFEKKKVYRDFPSLPEGAGIRDFVQAAKLYAILSGLTPPITEQRFTILCSKTKEFNKFVSKEDFCFKATDEEVKKLMDLNEND